MNKRTVDQIKHYQQILSKALEILPTPFEPHKMILVASLKISDFIFL